eukprot:TRINITY_DN1503_c0_g1::TRINITY_DN1503_c0_g1_i1::g.28180::m.28180 TRINITY_DN1503_c0_g1::TRINITY_DN1503_c0_g1_i1::g.28180  ORF type:complete len:295 (-),score=86.31,sp/P42125/ECI1_MOUSE/44.44/2e-70,ECH/PF00378.15/5.4e-51 TRINITY_DN1503_c0_g1_i1:659-1543(-)
MSLLLRTLRSRSATVAFQQTRFSSSSGLVTVEREGIDGKPGSEVAVVKMNRKPVNSLNVDLLKELKSTFQTLHQDKTCRGMIFASNMPSVFSAGLDINELYKTTPERVVAFWGTLQDVWLELFGSRLATIAAIQGHAPAGGCLLAICCDYRIMGLIPNGKLTIGLNETQLGIVAPPWFRDTMQHTIGARHTELCLQKGLLLDTETAKSIGVIDVHIERDKVMDVARKEMKSWLSIPDYARYESKMLMRRDILDRLRKTKEAEIQFMIKTLENPVIQKSLDRYMAALAAKAEKKN